MSTWAVDTARSGRWNRAIFPNRPHPVSPLRGTTHGRSTSLHNTGWSHDSPPICDRRDGQAIIPEPASHWDIAPDGKTEAFYLRQGVKFHDGAGLTAEDVHATLSRIIWPPKGSSRLRQPLFSAVSEGKAVDPCSSTTSSIGTKDRSYKEGASE